MTEQVTLQAGWALWGKQPGTRQDYSVLGCSPEPFSRTDYAAIIARFAVGSPDANAVGPGALPWVTVSWVGVDNNLQLGISITSHSDQVDGVGRPITQTAYFCVPYTQLAQTPVSYWDLYKAVAPLVPSLSFVDGPTIQLAMPAMSGDRLAETVQAVGERTAAATAALLLSGPVSVVQAEGTQLRERLQFIDAVASLLPYGYRARFSGATWSDTGSRHRVRLAFAARPAEGAGVIHWRRTTDAGQDDSVTASYCNGLRRLAQPPSLGRVGIGLPMLIERLAADTKARNFDRPQEAVDCLVRVDRPFRVLRQVQAGEAVSLAELRAVLRSGVVGELTDEDQVVGLLLSLARQAEGQDWPRLQHEADRLDSADDKVRIMGTFGRRMLRTVPQDVSCAAECLRFAAGRGLADAVLAEFLRAPDAPGSRLASASQVADLLVDTVLTSHEPVQEYPLTREALLENLGIAAELLLVPSSYGNYVDGLLGWLDPQDTGVLSRAVRAALGIGDGQVDAADLEALDSHERDVVVRLLVRAAWRTGHLNQILPGLTHWLAGYGALRRGGLEYWIDLLRELTPRDPESQAWLDTASLMVGGTPSSLPPTQSDAPTRYARAMAGIWAHLNQAYELFNVEACIRALAGYLGKQSWATGAGQASAVVELAALLENFEQGEVLKKTVASVLASTPAARDWPFAGPLITWAAYHEPEAVQGRLLDKLADPRSKDPDVLARLCADACGADIDADAALSNLVESGAVTEVAQAEQLILALQRHFSAAGIDEDCATKWKSRLGELLAGDAFGTGFIRDLRARVNAQTLRDLQAELRWLEIFATFDPDGSYEWTDEERTDLAKIAAKIESLLKQPSRRVRWHPRT